MQAITSAGEGFLLKDRSASRPEFYAARLLVRDGVLVLLFVDLIHGFVWAERPSLRRGCDTNGISSGRFRARRVGASAAPVHHQREENEGHHKGRGDEDASHISGVRQSEARRGSRYETLSAADR